MEWTQIMVTGLSGGAMGAILTHGFTLYRSRKKTISIKQSINTLFASNNSFNAKITFENEIGTFPFDNAYIVEIELRNTKLINTDYANFTFSIEVNESVATIIKIDAKGTGKKHVVDWEPNVDFATRSSCVNFTLKPFNRRDIYYISLLVTCSKDYILKSKDIEFDNDLGANFDGNQLVADEQDIGAP